MPEVTGQFCNVVSGNVKIGVVEALKAFNGHFFPEQTFPTMDSTYT
jgi:hypothetical protein